MDTRTLRLAAAVAVVGIVGALAVASAPAESMSGYMWPTGLATGVLLWGTRRQAPVLAAALFVASALSFLPGHFPVEVTLGFAAAITAEALLVDRLIPRRHDGWPWLLRTNDVARYTAACTAGAAVGTVGFTLTSLLTGHGTAWEIGLAVAARHLASQLIVVPLFLNVPPRVLRRPRPQARRRIPRWALLIGLTMATLVPTGLPSLVFLLLPVLGWASLRSTLRETQWMVAMVAAVAGVSTDLGYGPFSGLSERFMASPELALVPMYAFLVACALVCIPFALAVRQEREALRAAAAERSLSDRLVDAAEGLVIVGTDDLGRINLFNSGAQRVLGYTQDEVMGASPEMFHTDDEIARIAGILGCKAEFFDVVATFLARAEPTPMDWEFVRKDGEKRILAFLLTPMHAADGQVLGFLASADDMTERVRTQHALESALVAALAAESDAVSKLAEVDRAKDAFVSAVSHELRTPITNLLGYLELLRDGSYGDLRNEQAHALSRIELNSRRLLTLIDDLLTLARIDEPQFTAGHVPVDLCALVERAAAGLRQRGEAEGLDVLVDALPEPLRVFGDADQLDRLLANLADNAAKFTPAGGTVTLRLRTEGDIARLDVVDTGVGIPEDEQSQVFHRFFRSSTAQEGAVRGTGLGLFIAKAIVEAHGARIDFESTPGHGSTFTVRLPLADSRGDGPGSKPATDTAGHPATA